MIGYVIATIVVVVILGSFLSIYLFRKYREEGKDENDPYDFMIHGMRFYVRVDANKKEVERTSRIIVDGMEHALSVVFRNDPEYGAKCYSVYVRDKVWSKIKYIEFLDRIPDPLSKSGECTGEYGKDRIKVALIDKCICRTALAHELMHAIGDYLLDSTDSSHSLGEYWEGVYTKDEVDFPGVVNIATKYCLEKVEG